MDEPEAFFNGKWIAASAAAIPVGDAGFVLGATVAEQLRTFGGELFRLEDHLARLEQSLQVVGVDPGMPMEEFARVARELAARNHRLLVDPARWGGSADAVAAQRRGRPGDDLGLSILVTPGPYPAYAPPRPGSPTVCLHTYPLPFHLWAEKYRRGEALVSSEVEQISPRSWPPGLKCRSRMHYYLADRRAASGQGGARALLMDREGFVTEASTANLVVFRSSEGLISPPPEKILRGISLAVLVELARELGMATVYRDLRPQEVASADEVLLTSTPVCVLPVTHFDGRPVGDGRPGEVFRRLLAAWSELVGVEIAGQAESLARRRI